MSTSGSFNPPSDPACPQPMTRAALIALRNAGGLSIQCHYLVTDGPVIGVTGNTSPTQILMHAVSANELSTIVHVNTTFGPTASVWQGGYDIDFGTVGSIFVLTDDWNNHVSDSDIDAPTVHTQFPWHARGALLRDNTVDDCTLTDWHTAVAAGVLITDNDFLNAGIHLTGMSSGQVVRNIVQGPQININSPSILFNSNSIQNSPVTLAGINASLQSFQSNTVLSGNVNVTPATTGNVSMDRNVIGGQGITGYRVRIDGATGSVSVSGNRLFNQGPNITQDLRISGGAVAFDSNTVGAGSIDLNASGTVTVQAGSFTRATLTVTAGTTIQALSATNSTTAVSAPAGSTLSNVDMITSTLNLTGAATVTSGRMTASTLTNAGFGVDTFEMLGGSKTMTANQSNSLFSPAFDNWV